MWYETKSNKGFTLIELLVALAVAAILVGVAVPSMASFISNQRVKTTIYDLYAQMAFARAEAVKRGTNVYMYPNTNWQDGWIITTVVGKTYAQCVSDQTGCLKIQPAASGVTFTASPASIQYQRNGRTTASAQWDACDSDTSADITKRSVVVDLNGRATTEYNGYCA